MGLYLMKSLCCLAGLLLFYKLVLEGDKSHVVKRFYLLGALLMACLIPLMTFTEVLIIAPQPQLSESSVGQLGEMEDVLMPINFLAFILWSLYGLGVLFFSWRFLRNLYRIYKDVTQNKNETSSFYTKVLLAKNVVPHSFLNYVFLNRVAYEEKCIPKEVIKHEEAHVRQKHSLDVLFVELLQIVLWFNPLIYFFKKSIKLNHEFLADEAVTAKSTSPFAYQHILVNYSGRTHHSALSSPINYSLTKKRLIMLSKQSSKHRWLKMLAILPLLSILILSFSTKETVIETAPIKTELEALQDYQLKIEATSSIIMLNGKKVLMKNLTNEINELTKNWPDDALTGYSLKVKFENISAERRQAIETAFKKSRIGKANPEAKFAVPPAPPSLEDMPSPPLPPNAAIRNQTKVEVTNDENLTLTRNDKNPPREIFLVERQAEELENLARLVENQARVTEKNTKLTEERAKNVEALTNETAKLNRDLEKKALLLERKARLVEKKAEKLAASHKSTEKRNEVLEKRVALAEERKLLLLERNQFLGERQEYMTKRYNEGNVIKENDVHAAIPPIPPIPPIPAIAPSIDPVNLVIKMAQEDAKFFYEGSSITSNEALEIVNKSKQINMMVNKDEGIVKLSTTPFTLEKK